LEKVPRKQAYAPVVFSSGAAISSADRLLLGFKSLALSAVQGKDVPYGKIVHGSTFSVNSLALHTICTKAGSAVAALENIVTGTETPRLLLNRHCNKCEFRSECRAKAIENDDVSLIQTLKPKDIAKLNKKGIFTLRCSKLSGRFEDFWARRADRRPAA
jgi:predicted RecB family nuclease